MMDWPLHPGAVTRPAPKRHGNAGMVNNKTRDKIREARERQDDGALVPDSRLLTSPVWQPPAWHNAGQPRAPHRLRMALF